MPDAPARPRQTTWSGWVILLGSVFVLATAFEVVAGITSLETRKATEELLTTPPADGLGLGVDQALQIRRVTAIVAGACAVAAAILGWQVLRRSRSARIALSVLALPLLVTGTVTGAILSAAVVAAVVTLWLPPSVDWFAGRDPAPSEKPGDQGSGQRTDAPVSPGAGDAVTTDRGVSSTGRPDRPGPTAATGTARPRGPRPTALTAACMLTWVGAATLVIFGTLSVLVVWTSPDMVLDAVQQQDPSLTEQRLADQGLSVRAIQVATVVVVAVPVLWAFAASVVAGFALAGRTWARTTLLVSAVVAGLLSAGLSLLAPVLAVLMILCGVAAFLLVRPEVRDWR